MTNNMPKLLCFYGNLQVQWRPTGGVGNGHKYPPELLMGGGIAPPHEHF